MQFVVCYQLLFKSSQKFSESLYCGVILYHLFNLYPSTCDLPSDFDHWGESTTSVEQGSQFQPALHFSLSTAEVRDLKNHIGDKRLLDVIQCNPPTQSRINQTSFHRDMSTCVLVIFKDRIQIRQVLGPVLDHLHHNFNLKKFFFFFNWCFLSCNFRLQFFILSLCHLQASLSSVPSCQAVKDC